MRVVDIVLSFPIILLLIVVAYIVGPGLSHDDGDDRRRVLGSRGARIITWSGLSLRETAFIEAARVIGVSTPG